MAVMNNTIVSATGSFGIESAAAMASKAVREYERCKKAQSDNDRRDAALNCAMTVWHICDWAWAGIVAVGRREPDLAELLGVSGQKMQKDDLVAWAVTACPALGICQAICNGTKHVRSDRSIRTAMTAGDVTGNVSKLIIDDGTNRDILPILEEAVSFWYVQTIPSAGLR